MCMRTAASVLSGRTTVARPTGVRCRHGKQMPRPARAAAAADDSAGSSSSSTPVPEPLELLRSDLQFIERRADADMRAVADAHYELAALLNPTIATKLEEQIAGLQSELAAAHVAVHQSESQLSETVVNLSELQRVAAAMAAAGTVERPGEAALSRDAASAAAGASSPATPLAPLPQGEQQQRSARSRPASPRPSRAELAARSRHAGLSSGLDLPDALKQHWYPLDFSDSLRPDTMLPLELFGQAWVLFRDETGRAACVADECAHRACPLSLGRVVEGQLECPYHGWRYDGAGACTRMPSTAQHCRGIAVRSLPIVEAEGLIWVWPGEAAAAAAAPPPLAAVRPPPGFQVHARLSMDVPVDHGLLIENLLDLAHAPFTHTTTFAKGWPVPEAVRFHASNLLDGRWDPYPIDMQFLPPCMVLSTIGLASPGRIERGVRQQQCANHLHQLHVCLPAGRGRTRLLYLMSLDFLHWTRAIPGIQEFWRRIAGQVLGEDLALVAGQQDRLLRGGNTWAHPVSYDKLGVRYRRWRTALESGDASDVAAARVGLRRLSAGELFSAEDSQDDWS